MAHAKMFKLAGLEFNVQYMIVWAALLIATLVEVVIPEPQLIGIDYHFSRIFVVLSLILIALAKTFMVGWYYMHLIEERPTIILVACAPFLFSIFLTIGLFPYTFTDGDETEDNLIRRGDAAPIVQPEEATRYAASTQIATPEVLVP